MATNKTALGNRGEDQAASHLESLGYNIVERNYRCKHGEIDLVAKEKTDLVFVEVKTRRSMSCGYGSEAVDKRKRQKLAKSAISYLDERGLGEIDCRFDIVEVYLENGHPVRFEIIKGAFSSEE